MKNTIIFFALFLAVAPTGCNLKPKDDGQQPQAKNKPAPPPTVEAVALLREYGENNVRADQKYKGRLVRVHGQVTGFLGKSVLVEHAPAITSFLTNRNDISKLDKGRDYTFEGTVSIGNAGGVWLKNAKVIGE